MEQTTDATVAQLDDFDEIVDVRSPAEYALDHVCGAMNCPVLSDEERARVGTLYVQVSPFHAKRVGAALVARNIAHALENRLQSRPPSWRPLVYCWRGGERSGAMCEILRRVGWRAARLQGGYRAYRRAVIEGLASTPRQLDFVVLCGRTGSGKSEVLRALAELGEQVLDLERLACHRGSVLGEEPGHAQPSQKHFESRLWSSLRALDPARPVFVEAESRKIGNVQIPGELIAAMRASRCVVLNADQDVRVRLLLEQYEHFTAQAALICERLQPLSAHYGAETIARWRALAQSGRHAELVAELLTQHYDPAYDRSIERNFAHAAHAEVVTLAAATPEGVRTVAARIQDSGARVETA